MRPDPWQPPLSTRTSSICSPGVYTYIDAAAVTDWRAVINWEWGHAVVQSMGRWKKGGNSVTPCQLTDERTRCGRSCFRFTRRGSKITGERQKCDYLFYRFCWSMAQLYRLIPVQSAVNLFFASLSPDFMCGLPISSGQMLSAFLDVLKFSIAFLFCLEVLLEYLLLRDIWRAVFLMSKNWQLNKLHEIRMGSFKLRLAKTV